VNAQPHVKWTVIRQEEHPTLTPEGQPTTEHHTTFRTEHGHESTIVTPDHEYSAENVARAIHHKARELSKVKHLTSESEPAPPGQG
jgi:hypothetical protein